MLDVCVPIRYGSWSSPHDLPRFNKGCSQVCFFTACLLLAPQVKTVPGALHSPFSRIFFNCSCRTFPSPSAMQYKSTCSALCLMWRGSLHPVPLLCIVFWWVLPWEEPQPGENQLSGVSLCLSNERVVCAVAVTFKINQGPCVTPQQPVLAESMTPWLVTL